MKKRLLDRINLIYKYGIIFHKPLYMARLFANIFGVFLKYKKPLRGIDFAITYACDMKCQHCFANTLKKTGNEQLMSVEQYNRVAKESMSLGCTYFGFQGGELFLRKEYLDIIKAVYPRRNRIAITTNGSYVNESIIKQLKGVGVDIINFSLDSGIAYEHDKFRGIEGAFQRIMDAIKITKKYRIRITINATVHHDNLRTDGFCKLIEFANRNKILINTLFAAPSGQWQNNNDVLLSEDDIVYYNKLREKYPYVVRDIDSGFYGAGCPAVKEVLYISPYGDVLGCPFIHLSLGNIFRDSLEAIRKRGLKDAKFNYYHRYHHCCLIAEDRDFIKKYLDLIKGAKELPLDYLNLPSMT
jgi:MoaA/NifB/PqqE/SkfB family radical SAM enzyme